MLYPVWVPAYRSETENLRQRVEELERELAKSHRNIEALEQELAAEHQNAEVIEDEARADTSVPGHWIAAVALVGTLLGLVAAVVYSNAWFLLAGLVTGAGIGWASGRLGLSGSGVASRGPRSRFEPKRPAIRMRLAEHRDDEEDRADDEVRPSTGKRSKRAPH